MSNLIFRRSLLSLEEQRLRCLEIAVKAAHPDDPAELTEIIGNAEVLMRYVVLGERPKVGPASVEEIIDENAMGHGDNPF